MAKARGNPKIAEYGKNTQFGNGLSAVECGKASQQKQAEAKAEKKTIASALQLILDAKIPEAMAKKMQAQTGISELDYRTALAYSVISTGIKKSSSNSNQITWIYCAELFEIIRNKKTELYCSVPILFTYAGAPVLPVSCGIIIGCTNG